MDTLWGRFYRAKYVKNGDIRTMQPKAYHSRQWKRLIEGRDIAEEHIHWKLCTGNINFWVDNWCTHSPLIDKAITSVDVREMVVDYRDNLGWNLARLLDVLPAGIAKDILGIQFFAGGNDTAIWDLSSDGDFSVKSVWHHLHRRTREPNFFAYI